MINREATIRWKGYDPADLKTHSNKRVWRVCDECGKGRWVVYNNHSEICVSCTVSRPKSEDHRRKIGDGNRGKTLTQKTRMLLSELNSGENNPWYGSHRCGSDNPNWQGGISFGKYCPKFNNGLKQQIRDQYNNCDYISGLSADICNPHRELDVHHIDYNKQQGCEDHEWRLIPLSQKNHLTTNGNRPFWNKLFTYSLQYDRTYYEYKSINIFEVI